jgi:hypothetical protein
MKIQYQIFEIVEKDIQLGYEDGFGRGGIRGEETTMIEAYWYLNWLIFDSLEEAIQKLSTLEKGKYTILTVYEIS